MKLTAEHITFSYGTTQILTDISLAAETGEFIGIIGPNGSGKSTFLKCIYRVLKPKQGAVFLDSEEVKQMTMRKSARKMAVVGQHHPYNFEFKVQEVVLMGRTPHKKPMEPDHANDFRIVEEALKQVGMSEFLQRNFSSLSGGEQQRVILARALAQQTPCLILDEPTNHLDITHQLQLFKTIQKLNVTVIAAIHDLNIAASFCDRIFVLKEGRLVSDGTPKAVLSPELLNEIYGVKAEITYDSKGNMHILFLF